MLFCFFCFLACEGCTIWSLPPAIRVDGNATCAHQLSLHFPRYVRRKPCPSVVTPSAFPATRYIRASLHTRKSKRVMAHKSPAHAVIEGSLGRDDARVASAANGFSRMGASPEPPAAIYLSPTRRLASYAIIPSLVGPCSNEPTTTSRDPHLSRFPK